MDAEHFIYLIPLEIWTKIFTYLPRRDRFVCMCLSSRWKEALDVPSLWKHMAVALDVDFFEVSTIQLTIDFCKYIKSLELRFDSFDEPIQWINCRMVDITKRIYRFLSIFVNKNLQINRLYFTNFCVFYRMKKILYYLTMFLRSQTRIHVISFDGSFFAKKTFVRLLLAALSTNGTSIRHLDIQNAYVDVEFQEGQYHILANQLVMGVSNITHLQILRIDFESLINNNLLTGILNGSCTSLEKLDIRIAEEDLINLSYTQLYPNSVWLNLKKRLPALKVSVNFHNIFYEYSFIDKILTRSIPMFSISWVSDGFLFKDLVRNSFRKYPHSLESVRLTAKEYYLNEYVMFALEECPNLKCIEITGTVVNFCRMQQCFLQADFLGFQKYELYVQSNQQGGEIYVSCEVIYKNSLRTCMYEHYKIPH